MNNEITAANFDETFNLDYVAALADGLSKIDINSVCVSKLVYWCAERGYDVSPSVCLDVLVLQAEALMEMDK